MHLLTSEIQKRQYTHSLYQKVLYFYELLVTTQLKETVIMSMFCMKQGTNMYMQFRFEVISNVNEVKGKCYKIIENSF
jgi:hypothetical protein